MVRNLCLLSREEFAAVILERVTGEFNSLQFNVSQTQDHPLVSEITPVRNYKHFHRYIDLPE